MAQIEKRGDLQWRARIKKKGFPEQSKTFFTKKDAEDWAKVIESEMIRGTFIARTDSEKVTFGDLVDRYLREVTPSKKNWKSETEIMSKIKEITCPACAKMKDSIEDIKTRAYQDGYDYVAWVVRQGPRCELVAFAREPDEMELLAEYGDDLVAIVPI